MSDNPSTIVSTPAARSIGKTIFSITYTIPFIRNTSIGFISFAVFAHPIAVSSPTIIGSTVSLKHLIFPIASAAVPVRSENTAEMLSIAAAQRNSSSIFFVPAHSSPIAIPHNPVRIPRAAMPAVRTSANLRFGTKMSFTINRMLVGSSASITFDAAFSIKVFTSPYSVMFPTVCFVSSKYCCHSEKSYSLRSRSNSVSTFCIPSSGSSSARTFRGNASTAMHTAINAHTAKPLTTLVDRNPHFPVIALHAPFFIAPHKRFIISITSFWKTYSAGQRLPSCMYFFSSCMPLLFTV